MLRLGEWKGLRLSPRRWSPLLRRVYLDPPPPWRELERDRVRLRAEYRLRSRSRSRLLERDRVLSRRRQDPDLRPRE